MATRKRRGGAPSPCLVERPRTQLAAHQAQINTKIAKEKDNEIAALRVRHAAASAECESTASGDSNDSPSLLVSAAADWDFKQLIEDAEKALATLPGLPGVPREERIGALMDFHAITPAGVQHVLTTHREQTDESPLQLISAARLAYYQRIEAEYLRLRQALVLECDANEIAS